MRTQNNHPQWQHQPLRLTDEDKKDLLAVLEEFFNCFHLQDVRQMLWEWLVVALSSDKGDYTEGIERNSLIHLYEKLELLVEASWMLNRKNLKRRSKLQRKSAAGHYQPA